MAWIYWYENYQNTLINLIDWDSFGFVNRETSMSLLKIRASFVELSRIETGLSWTSFTVNSFEKMHLTNCMIFLFFDCIYLLWNDSSKASPQIALVVPIWFDKIRYVWCLVRFSLQANAFTRLYCHSDQLVLQLDQLEWLKSFEFLSDLRRVTQLH